MAVSRIEQVHEPRLVRPHVSLDVVLPFTDAISLLLALVIARPDSVGALIGVTLFLALGATGSQATRIEMRLARDMWRVLAGGIAALVVVGSALHSRVQTGELTEVGALSLAMLLGGRTGAYALLKNLRRRGVGLQPAILVRRAADLRPLLDELRSSHDHGLVPIGYVGPLAAGLGLDHLGELPWLSAVVAGSDARHVIVADAHDPSVVGAIRSCWALAADIHFAVPRSDFIGRGRNCDHLGGVTLLRLRRLARRGITWRMKRIMDIAAGSALLAVSAPVLLLATIAVRLSSPGPVLHRQKRVGEGGVPFEMLKFRSMRLNEDSETTWNVGDDPRVTRVGRFLRKTGLDELPQLLNVIRGEMSLVGPRPERPFFVDQFEVEYPDYADRHRVLPGITGWAQVNGLRGDTSIADRARADNWYVDNWSLLLDLEILMRTIPTLLRGTGG